MLGRITEEHIEDANDEVFKREQYTYDVNGNKTSTTLFTQAGTATTKTEYSPDGKPVRVTDALGNQTLYDYNYAFFHKGQKVLQITKIDPLGNKELITHDTHENVCSHVKTNKFDQIIQNEESFYDALGQKTHSHIIVYEGLKQKRVIETTWEYDAMGNVTDCIEAVGTPEQRSIYHYYNQYGQKERTVMPNGISIINEYDIWGRLSSYKSSDDIIHYQYTYDLKDRPILIKDLVHNTTNTRSYDEHGRLTSETLDNGLTLSYTYDQLNRPATVILPDQTAIHYRYNAHHLTSIERINGNVTYTHHYNHYDLAGNLTEETLLDQVGKIRYDYDLLERPISVQAPHWKATIPQNGFDTVGNLLERKISDNQGSLTYKYAYDSLYQLVSENGFTSHTYQNDSIYNRAVKDDQPYDVNALNQLLSQTNCSYHYDQNGNLIEKITGNHSTRYVYDALDRLIEVDDGKHITTYTYDSFHRRLSKTHNGLTTQFIYQNKKEIGAINQGKITQLRVLGIAYGAEIGGAVILELDGKTYAPIHDSQGNIVALIDPSGKLIESYRYTAFGEIEIFSEKAVNNPWRFSSKRFDEETGFIFFGRRYYAPEIGRWTTADPAGYADGPNLYAYVHNQPLIYIDPDGRFSFPIVFANPLQMGNNAMSLLGNTRFQGAAQAAGGLAEVMVGAGITGLSEGIAAPIGFGIMAHGFDQTFTGLQTMFTGVHHKTATSQGLEMTGMSPQMANLFDTSLSMAGSMGGIAALRTAEASIPNLQFPKCYQPDYQIPSNSQILFGQKTVASTFSKEGEFAYKSWSISAVSKGLRNGSISPNELPIEIFIRDKQIVTLNNRSLLTLRRAGMQPTKIINRTSSWEYENTLIWHLRGGQPSDVIRIRGGPPGASLID